MTVDIYNREWIINNSREILSKYAEGITVRQLHYRLVAIGMINDLAHYKRVVSAMTKARWDGVISMDSFIDRERSMYGQTEIKEKNLGEEIENAKHQIRAWMESYGLNRWSNQDNYVEVGIEKKALQGVFETPCLMAHVGLAPFKGYSSLTFLKDANLRFRTAQYMGKKLFMLYFGDHDPSGDNIPDTIKQNLLRLGVDVDVIRIAVTPDQIEEMNLPGVPPKVTDTRTLNWDGTSAVECDAIEPNVLADMCKNAIEEYFDRDVYRELKSRESEERAEYRKALKEFVRDLKDEYEDEGV